MMSIGLLNKIENKIYWGIVGTLLTIAFGVIGLYTFFHERKPSLSFEIINETNVLDVHKNLEDLTIYFKSENIQKNNLNLRIITIQVLNNGEVDILQSYYDQKMKWGFRVSNGKIINDARIVNSNSEYLRNNISPKVVGDNTVELEKVIFEKGKFFSVEVLVIHNKSNLPEIEYVGKIVGIEKIIPIKTWEKRLEQNFWDSFFYGGFLINVIRPIIYFILFVLVILIAVLVDKIRRYKRNANRALRQKEIHSLLDGAPKSEILKMCASEYILNGSYSAIEKIDMLLNNPNKSEIEKEIKKMHFVNDYYDKITELEKAAADQGILKNLVENNNINIPKRYISIRPDILSLLEENVIVINEQGEIKIDQKIMIIISNLLKQLKEHGKLSSAVR